MPDTIKASIIIPVLNEAQSLDAALTHLHNQPGVADDCEILVCDGGSHDATLEIARRHPCRIQCCERGRARQMNAAAAVARGSMLLFLHADSRLPSGFNPARQLDTDWGFFRLRLSGQTRVYRVIESAINWRTRLTRIAGGDQGLYFRRELFTALGGYPEIPLMEDIAICKRARKLHQPRVIDAPLTSSSRRWQQRGVVKTVLLMWSLRLAFWLGIKPERLHRIYYP